jgi:hypothetical protein
MIKLKSLLTEKINTSKWHTGWNIIDDFDKIPQFKKFRIKGAEYDDVYFEIPTDIFTKVTGLNEKDVIRIDRQLDSYEGNISWNSDRKKDNPNQYKINTVIVSGGA